jgi:hypothetical protein
MNAFSFPNTEETKVKNFEEEQKCCLQSVVFQLQGLLFQEPEAKRWQKCVATTFLWVVK